MEFDYSQLPPTVPQYKKVTLTANQIKALAATPVELVAAPGAGYVVVPVFFATSLQAGATPFTVPSGGLTKMIIGTTYGASLWDWTIADDSFTNAADYFKTLGTLNEAIELATADYENKPLYLTRSTSDEFTLGDGTADAIFHYFVIPIV